MKYMVWGLVIVMLLSMGCAAKTMQNSVLFEDNPTIRVLLMDSSPRVSLIPGSAWRVKNARGEEIFTFQNNTEATLYIEDNLLSLRNDNSSHQSKSFLFEPSEKNGTMEIRREGREHGHIYEGRIEAYPGDNNMPELILSLPMEEYLKGVVPYEIGPASPMEAQCAQAVAARSESYVALVTGKYAGDRYDICSDVHCQVFRGNERRSETSDEAVHKTRGCILMFEGLPVSAYYASTCGGHTEDIRMVWPHRSEERAYWEAAGFDSDVDYSLDLTQEEHFRKWLKMSPDVFCNPEYSDIPKWTHKNFRWAREVKAEDLTVWISEEKDIGRVIALQPLKRGVSGRIIELEFIGERGTVVIGPELKIRRTFKPALRSGAFVVDPQGSPDRPGVFLIRGAGSGHGVGMCQVGAIGMANAGKSFREILNHYYPKAKIKVLY